MPTHTITLTCDTVTKFNGGNAARFTAQQPKQGMLEIIGVSPEDASIVGAFVPGKKYDIYVEEQMVNEDSADEAKVAVA